jgi:phospho-N-acetylmuramoyl-pentapeptide-transferase
VTQAAAFWLAFGVSAAVAWPVMRVLHGLQARQTISEFAPEGHQQKQGTPTMGGLIALCGLVAVLAAGGGALPALVVILGLGAIGLIDDFVLPRLRPGARGLGWRQKLALQVVVAACAAALVPEWMPSVWLAVAGAVAIVYFANAYNFADGLDGLAGGLGVLLALTLAALAYVHDARLVGLQTFALAGALIPFLLLNAPPAKVFMGDAGALPVGGLIGLWVAQLALAPPWAVPLDITLSALLAATLVLHAVLIPVPIQVFWVKAFRRRLFPYTPIHHAFERAGWPETRVTATFLIVQFLLGMLTVTILQRGFT